MDQGCHQGGGQERGGFGVVSFPSRFFRSLIVSGLPFSAIAFLSSPSIRFVFVSVRVVNKKNISCKFDCRVVLRVHSGSPGFSIVGLFDETVQKSPRSRAPRARPIRSLTISRDLDRTISPSCPSSSSTEPEPSLPDTTSPWVERPDASPFGNSNEKKRLGGAINKVKRDGIQRHDLNSRRVLLFDPIHNTKKLWEFWEHGGEPLFETRTALTTRFWG